MLDKALVYEMRLSRLKLDSRRVFPSEISGFPAATKKSVELFQANPRVNLLEEQINKSR
jgi:hypothetical protein